MPETTGYLFGIFDLFHLDHLDSVRMAAERCDRLVVGVATDELVEQVCGVRPFVPAIERVEIIGAVRVVAEVRELGTADAAAEARRAGAGVLFLVEGELDAVQFAAAPEGALPAGLTTVQLPAARRTASAQVRTALDGRTNRSSVA